MGHQLEPGGRLEGASAIALSQARGHGGMTERDYWKKLMPEAVDEHDQEVCRAPMPCTCECGPSSGCRPVFPWYALLQPHLRLRVLGYVPETLNPKSHC